MRIEKLNNEKIKISFTSEELKENNISVHSFLSGSNQAQKLLIALLEIANEEFGFNFDNSNISSETISFKNKKFIIFVTKSAKSTANPEKISPYNLLDLVDYDHTQTNNSLSFLPPKGIFDIDKIIYKFENIEDVFLFSKYANSELPIKNLDNSLYRYENFFVIIINIKKLADFQKQLVISILSEYKNYIYLSEFAYTKLIEHSYLILENQAIQGL